MTISVIITTYNHPKWLQKVLWGYAHQTHEDFELVIADDGSSEETKQVIERFQRDTPNIPLQHIWHEDQGFRKTQILNKAILASQGEYLVFTDGDCVPRADFLTVHGAYAKRGYFLSGGYCKLPMELSRAITEHDIRSGVSFDYKWLHERGLQSNSARLKLSLPQVIRPIADLLTPTKPTWNGMSSSTYRDYLLEVNGFNEEMQYGGLDRELGERLWNLGLKSKQIRHRAVCLHLDHSRGYKDEELVAANRARRQQAKDQKIVCCAQGIEQFDTPLTYKREVS